MGKILVVDDKEGIRTFIAEALSDAGHVVATAADGMDALSMLEKEAFHLMISDLKMPGMDGMALLEKVRTVAPEMVNIMLTAHGTVETAVAAMKMGAFDYLTKPLSGPDELRIVVSRALQHRATLLQADATEDEKRMVAEDPATKAVLSLIHKVAITDSTVLLLGESGTGKEEAAKEIHRRSPRRDAPFVPVNCAAISETLVESEMFGHEKGAFTGATERRIGRFEQADGGTLFLDEVGELPLSLQAKLLRVIQEQTFERVGGNQTVSVNVRIVAATNRELEKEIREGRFREDLFHRLSVFPIRIPPLKERRGDIPALVAHLLRDIARRINRPNLSLRESALTQLIEHTWPGNVRELGNVLERAAIISDTDQIEQIPLTPGQGGHQTAQSVQLSGSLRELERSAIEQALKSTDGHRKKAAEQLGISLRSLYNKIKEYGLD